MAIIIDYVTPGTGATAGYHVVQQVSIDYRNKRSAAQLESFVSAQTYLDGKQPVFSQSIGFSELPPADVDPRVYAKQKIVASADDKTSPTAARMDFIDQRSPTKSMDQRIDGADTANFKASTCQSQTSTFEVAAASLEQPA